MIFVLVYDKGISFLINIFSFYFIPFILGAAINSTVPDMLPFSSDGSPFLSRLEEGTGPRGALTNNSGNLGSMHSATPKVKKYHLLRFPGRKFNLHYHIEE